MMGDPFMQNRSESKNSFNMPWSSGQRARLLFQQTKFETCWSPQFLCKICVWKEQKITKRGRGWPIVFLKKRFNLFGVATIQLILNWMSRNANYLKNLLGKGFRESNRSRRETWATWLTTIDGPWGPVFEFLRYSFSFGLIETWPLEKLF